ncbi:MAG: bifunctional sulfate adenylyltransferase/adenylylsulfate kinase [Acidimicrobiia bacterium]|nr:bifunctional sulfate adenylyltransferase/adenylylsulfate kinase [Acidimicrobiia bacterium]MYC58290.1 bifunctional sulfate adenylyltransferase/adenylylsulfate kinase [Acidimicrobiia bacterium]MYI30003.1 bifunctional sulfate adenylyltransferase/adenylylsulfate kinase [Acidimicrobiia bacterium]
MNSILPDSLAKERSRYENSSVTSNLIQPHGGSLVDLLADSAKAKELTTVSRDLPSLTLQPRHMCDLELLLNGGFSPLRGFMGQHDYDRVCSEMRLTDGTLWPMPITLDTDEETAAAAQAAGRLALRDIEGVMLAVLTVSDAWQPDLMAEAKAVFATTDPDHPGVSHLLRHTAPVYLGGSIQGLQLPLHHDFTELRLTPAQLRCAFETRGWNRVVAFQTRNPMHRAHVELTRRAAVKADANLLIHPVVGMTKPGDVDHYTRGRVYQHIVARYPKNTAMLAMLPLAMRMGGPVEAVWHAIIRKNYGVSHLIVGRDHAGPGSNAAGEPFYSPYDAQEMLERFAEELDVTMVPFKMMVYLPDNDSYRPVDEVEDGANTLTISGTELRDRLMSGDDIPEWFSYPEVVDELRRTHPQKSKQGFTVFFTGLSGSGKSTIANALMSKLLETQGRPVTLLDGDVVRTNLSSELGFSKEHRDINITRIGYVASEITKHGGIAICAPIAPYAEPRRWNRETISAHGGYVLVHIATPLEVCEQRDRKGLYAKARAGIIKEFTGISDPYEEPTDADIVLPTIDQTPGEAAQTIMDHLVTEGYLA